MPASCSGTYRRVYVIDVDYWMTWIPNWEPPQVREGAKHICRILWNSGPQNVGKTDRCAFKVALREGERIAYEWNNSKDMATAELLIGAGGSA
jgi:hypothetical protein